jgi:hypothetical protein
MRGDESLRESFFGRSRANNFLGQAIEEKILIGSFIGEQASSSRSIGRFARRLAGIVRLDRTLA